MLQAMPFTKGQSRPANSGKQGPHYAKNSTYKSTWGTWRNMLARCRNPHFTGYKNYGGRGITVCERWRHFKYFLADMGIKPTGLTLERKDTNGHYSPDNCKWGSWEDQANNKRSTKFIEYQGVRMSMLEFSKLVNT